MLVLSRKKGQSILIGEGIELTILEVEGDTIKLGIAAPRDVQILRSELLTSVKESNKESVGLPHTLDFAGVSDVLQKKSQK
ncbi:carbon storage regulator CsrA [Cohnella rhizosphaerae]|uniref:Translational regulator CsrA n=1 Tax=Cohnella rhizosphaerae TaxID=1457232 RepID=A0A9X4KVF0_9BACL|nr:carbon storage regulator CsrA [Cohnella rhizosphaerae]MDG0811864.1 carbon storage regulator CsrA [Cohnella rhizosphaerae]